MNAEPPIARFQMEYQPRRPGYAKRYTSIVIRESAMTASDYLAIAQRYCRFLEAAKITNDEYAENLLTSCVIYPEVDENTAHKIAGTIPYNVRERVEREISKVLDASYRFPSLHYGGPGPSAEVREETRQLYEARIRVYATLLAKSLNMV